METNFIRFMFEWQTLIGAALPLPLWWIWNKVTQHQEWRKNIRSLHLEVISTANILRNRIHPTLRSFSDTRLTQLLDDIDRATQKGNAYAVNQVFFPLLPTIRLDKNILSRENTKSGFISNKLSHVQTSLESIDYAIQDVGRQLQETLQNNFQLGLKKAQSSGAHNRTFRSNIVAFKGMLDEQLLGESISPLIHELLILVVAIKLLQQKGIIWWKFYFGCHFRFFWNKKSLQDYREGTHERIEAYLDSEVNRLCEQNPVL